MLPPPSTALPRSVEEAERAAERVACVARAAAGLVLGSSIAVAVAFVPEADAAYLMPRLRVALTVMALFIVLAAISLAASRSQRYRPWLAYLFAAGDAALILYALHHGLLLAGHPGELLFAEPAAWLMPIAVAIQAVRFRAGPLVFAALLMAAVATGVMLFGGAGGTWLSDPAVATAAETAAETGAETGAAQAESGNRLAALFSAPPDVIRVLMLVIAAIVLVVSVRSKREILINGLGVARTEAALRRFLPDEVSASLTPGEAGQDAGSPLAGHRTLAVLFIDLVGFTAASEGVAPADVARWLAGFRERVTALVRANGGFVDKFIGDGIMAIFGYQSDPQTAARQALAVVEAMPATMADWLAGDASAPRFQAVVGGALGPVFAGVIGAGERREFTVIGDTVNLASRLEGAAKEHGSAAALSEELVAHGGGLSGGRSGGLAGAGERLDGAVETLHIRGHRDAVRVFLLRRGAITA